MEINHGIGERVTLPGNTASLDEQVLFFRHAFAYEQVKEAVAGKNVLEVGCGTAFGARDLGPLTKRFTAVDIDADLIQSLNHEKAARFSSQVDFQLFDGKKLPFLDHAFDVVLCFQVIEHVQDDLGFLQELARVLHPQGVLYLTTPNRLMRLAPGQRPFNFFHTREYSPHDFRLLVEKTALKLTLSGVFGDPSTHGLEMQRLKKYRSWAYRYIFQRFPKAFQQRVKKQVLALRKADPNQKKVICRFFCGSDNLENSIDLWVEIRW